MKRNKLYNTWFSFASFVVIFLIFSFVITICFLLFLKGTPVDESVVKEKAVKTFLNIFILTFMFTVIVAFIKYIFIDRRVDDILDATEKISKGDYSIRLYTSKFSVNSDFDLIYKNFNKMAEELSSTETLQTDFISNVSHEMKTPLAVIKNYSSLLQTKNISNDDVVEYAETIVKNTNRLNSLVTNILKLNKLENQKVVLEKSKFNLSESVSECLINFENLIEEKNINIQADIEDEIFIYSDQNMLELVWSNLISNAIKFTPKDGAVGVSCKKEKSSAGGVVVEVWDTGCGISSESGKHIFEKFYQGDTSHKTQGNGLGLALVKKIIDILGGEISVESEVGKGSKFSIAINTEVKK